MRTIGFAGSAKNTGKTSIALHLLDLAQRAGLRLALTSIGYDGEDRDQFTDLPKPRYDCQPGMVVATAGCCLRSASAMFSDLRPTGIRTVLGEVFIATVQKPGKVVLAGPNRGSDLRRLLDQLHQLGGEVTLVDGALNRLVALTAADGLVLSTGAAFDQRIEIIASHAAAMESLFHHPPYPQKLPQPVQCVTCLFSSGVQFQLPTRSVMDKAGMTTIAAWLATQQAATLIVPGIFEPLLFTSLVSTLGEYLPSKRFVFASPLHLLASGLPEVWQAALQGIVRCGAQVGYLRTGKVFFITVNPYYPRYVPSTGSHLPAWIDRLALLAAVRESITTTSVVDIFQPPLPDLLALCGLPGL